ncbi:hypothetical protein [Metabacillus sediminilitoris]|jgi:hypothetical protein|uniref:hypothetical protein n=1 Tax=Metabacillus sediminilitoris TaxID=2567941 RepID=UPI0012D7F37F|nr:hypothetical protein [Metabacillus sediminilitoris]QGQ44236.1 hypothetical protein GMB29_02325 [Metabacillus sediminilitoris]
MINWWLTTISLGGFLIISISLFLYALKSSVNTEESYRIDPLPNDENESKEE